MMPHLSQTCLFQASHSTRHEVLVNPVVLGFFVSDGPDGNMIEAVDPGTGEGEEYRGMGGDNELGMP